LHENALLLRKIFKKNLERGAVPAPQIPPLLFREVPPPIANVWIRHWRRAQPLWKTTSFQFSFFLSSSNHRLSRSLPFYSAMMSAIFLHPYPWESGTKA